MTEQSTTEQRARRTVFGEAADEYDAVRPDYPSALVSDLLAEAGAGPVLEIGAGTGKATRAFAGPGVDLVCVEPDARMAALLQRRAHPGVRVVVDQFETWPPDRGYGLLYSAQAWHWVDRASRNDLAWAALAPGGLLGLFWNAFGVVDDDLLRELQALDRHYWPDSGETPSHWRDEPEPVAARPFAEEWAELGLHEDDRFTDLRSRSYERTLHYSAADYARFLATTSLFRLLEPERLAAVRAEVVAAVDQRGGEIEIHSTTRLATARRV